MHQRKSLICNTWKSNITIKNEKHRNRKFKKLKVPKYNLIKLK